MSNVFKMWVEEGNKIVILENIDYKMGEEEFIEKMRGEFNEKELLLIEDLCYEGVKLSEEEYNKKWEIKEVKMNYKDYIKELKMWCKNYLED